ncbi:MAG: deoxyribodipyrimidine photo-lyase, partial [Shewanella algae]
MSQPLPNHAPSREKACVAIWFRSDLRTSDNQALWLACEAARAQGLPLRGFYIETPAQWQQHSVGPMQLDFIERSVNQLQRALASLGIAFDLLHCDDFSLVNATVESYCQRQGVKQIFAGREVEINEQRRDQALAQLTRTIGVGLQF